MGRSCEPRGQATIIIIKIICMVNLFALPAQAMSLRPPACITNQLSAQRLFSRPRFGPVVDGGAAAATASTLVAAGPSSRPVASMQS